MSYLDSGFNENLIRNQYPNSTSEYDSVNLPDIISGGSISDAQVGGLSVSKLRAGIISAVAQLGGDRVVMDGVSDDYGIKIYDKSGNMIIFLGEDGT